MNEFVTVSQIIFAFKALMPLFTFTFFVCVWVCFREFMNFIKFVIDFHDRYQSGYYSKEQRQLRQQKLRLALEKLRNERT